MSNRTTYALGAVALVLIAGIVVLALKWGRDGVAIRNDGYGPVRDPGVHSVLAPDGTITLGKADAAKTIDVYEDPICPGCGSMERTYGQEIAQKIDEGKLAVRYHLVNFLDPKSGSKNYSTRAIAANECVAEAGSGPVYSKFHELLFTSKQPKEGGGDLSNDELGAIAREAGATEPVIQCVTAGTKVAAAKINAKTAMDALTAKLGDKAATPAVYDGDTKIDVNDSEWVVSLTK
ncbi:DsbA family protein [Nocardia sp. NPDC052566]|uniref:DsbA family protein n=1 Tax=Nocardia sp. NPDC052566 TaxID=3364330 RepID=UPI0037C87800